MKYIRLTIAVLFFTVSKFSFAEATTIKWQLGADAPKTGVEQLNFPFSFSTSPDDNGIYFAYYLPLMNGGVRPYLGFQPVTPELEGRHTFHAIFSTFSPLAKQDDTNCNYGADGGKGVSCKVGFDGDLHTFYSIRVTEKLIDNIYYYSGDVYNDLTNTKVAHVGSFNFSASTGKGGLFKTSGGGFIESYLPKKGCYQSINGTYGQITGYQDSQEYKSIPVVGIQPKEQGCIKSTFTYLGDGTTSIQVRPYSE